LSVAAFARLIVFHLLCPAIALPRLMRKLGVVQP